MAKQNMDTLNAFLLIAVLLGIVLFASNHYLVGNDKNIYYDFNKVDLLNNSNVEVVQSQDNTHNSLQLNSGFDTSANSSNIKFITDFGVDLTNVSEYEYSYRIDISNETSANLNSIVSFEKNINLSNATEFHNLIDNFDFGLRTGNSIINSTNKAQLVSGSGLTNGRDEAYNYLEMKLRINKVDDFVVSKVSYQDNNNNNVSYINVERLSDITSLDNLVESAKTKWFIGDYNYGTDVIPTHILEGKVILDYIKLSYNE